MRKPLHVYDQTKEHWFQWHRDNWTQVEVPRIRRTRFTGTGTRFLSDAGRTAIDDLFERSFSQLIKEPRTALRYLTRGQAGRVAEPLPLASVAGHGGVDELRPGVDATHEIVEIAESLASEVLRRVLTTDTMVALEHDRRIRIETE